MPGTDRPVAYEGHHPDGSGVQAHSAGGLYPFVLVYRDAPLPGAGRPAYAAGVIGPGIPDVAWFNDENTAHDVARFLKMRREQRRSTFGYATQAAACEALAARTCTNCANAYEKCGLCYGPTGAITRWIPIQPTTKA